MTVKVMALSGRQRPACRGVAHHDEGAVVGEKIPTLWYNFGGAEITTKGGFCVC